MSNWFPRKSDGVECKLLKDWILSVHENRKGFGYVVSLSMTIGLEEEEDAIELADAVAEALEEHDLEDVDLWYENQEIYDEENSDA